MSINISEWDKYVKNIPNIIHKVMTPHDSLGMCGRTATQPNKTTNWNLCTCKECLKFMTSKTWKRLQTNKKKGKDYF